MSGARPETFPGEYVFKIFGRHSPTFVERVSAIVAGYGPADVTVGDALTYRADPAVLRRIVEASSGQEFRAYVTESILSPLMSAGGAPSGSGAGSRLSTMLRCHMCPQNGQGEVPSGSCAWHSGHIL